MPEAMELEKVASAFDAAPISGAPFGLELKVDLSVDFGVIAQTSPMKRAGLPGRTSCRLFVLGLRASQLCYWPDDWREWRSST
jgi:hypothetical protein